MKIGDIYEIETKLGKAYLHYVHKDETNGELVRILPGVYDYLPEDLNEIAVKPEDYLIFFPLKAAAKRKIVKKIITLKVNNFLIPKFMRTKHIVRGDFKGWHIVDVETWKRTLVQELDEIQIQLSPWGICNDTLLIERIESGWSLDKWV